MSRELLKSPVRMFIQLGDFVIGSLIYTFVVNVRDILGMCVDGRNVHIGKLRRQIVGP